MAKTGNSSDGKGKTKPRSRAARPSFAQPAAPAASSAWVYRSDAPAPAAAKPAAVAAKPAAVAAKPAAVAAKPAARAARVAAAAPATKRAARPAAPAAGSSRVVRTMDVVTLPIAVSLMAVLAPMRWLLGSSSRH